MFGKFYSTVHSKPIFFSFKFNTPLLSNPSFFFSKFYSTVRQKPIFFSFSPIKSDTLLLSNPSFFLACFYSTVCSKPIFFFTFSSSPLLWNPSFFLNWILVHRSSKTHLFSLFLLTNLMHRYYQTHLFFGKLLFHRCFKTHLFFSLFPIKSNTPLLSNPSFFLANFYSTIRSKPHLFSFILLSNLIHRCSQTHFFLSNSNPPFVQNPSFFSLKSNTPLLTNQTIIFFGQILFHRSSKTHLFLSFSY